MKATIEICRPALFSDGFEAPGVADIDIAHDEFGFPEIRGKRLKGLLVEAISDAHYALGKDFESAATKLCGSAGRATRAWLRVGTARVSASERNAVVQAGFSPYEVLNAYTIVRRKTAISYLGAPDAGSLRAERYLIPGLVLEFELDVDAGEDSDKGKALQLLAIAFATTVRGGVNRTRGAGRIRLACDDLKFDLSFLEGAA